MAKQLNILSWLSDSPVVKKTGCGVIFWIIIALIIIKGIGNFRKDKPSSASRDERPNVSIDTLEPSPTVGPKEIVVNIPATPVIKINRPGAPKPPRINIKEIAKFDPKIKKRLEAADPWFGKGDATAQYNIGWMYDYGKEGVSENDGEAIKWYRRAAENGHKTAMNNLAVFYENGGPGLARDEERAVYLFRIAAEAGNKYAQWNLGRMYDKGKGGLAEDDEESLKWIRKAAAQGHETAINHLKKRPVRKARSEESSSTQKRTNVSIAEQHYNKALKHMTQMRSIDTVFIPQELRKAANLGHVEAKYLLGREIKVMRPFEAIQLYKDAISQGHSGAKAALGEMYYNGYGVRMDRDLAVKYFVESANEGAAFGLYYLAKMHGGRIAAARDIVEFSFEDQNRLMRLSAEKGERKAWAQLGKWYREGSYGIDKNKALAIQAFTKAKELGHLGSIVDLEELTGIPRYSN